MCFSATGSFGAAAVLAGIGTFSLAQDKLPSHKMFAAVPLLFAVQQLAEGVVWMTLDHPAQHALHVLAVATFLAFALAVWPVWVPLSLLLAETDARRRKVLSILAGIGVFVALGAGAILIHGRPTAHVEGHRMAYDYAQLGSSRLAALYLPMYVIPAVIPFFASTLQKARLLGTVLVLALVATSILERETLTSVWCFFGALLSGVIVFVIAAEHRLAIRLGTHRPASA
jgi:hypothetical protein